MLISFDVDTQDERHIRQAIAVYQRQSYQACGEVIVAEGESDAGGAILAEICRGFIESRGEPIR